MATKINPKFEALNSKKVSDSTSGIRISGYYRTGFTLVELLISMAIISLLVALMVPTINRSLSRNNIANDFDLLKAKLEETRLLAASTQQLDSKTGYYALYLPQSDTSNGKEVDYFAIVRLTASDGDSSFVAPCTAETVIAQADPAFNGSRDCIVDRINFSSGVTLNNNNTARFVMYRAPNQQLFEGKQINNIWQARPPVFSWGTTVKLKLKSPTKTATISVDPSTGKLTVTYS